MTPAQREAHALVKPGAPSSVAVSSTSSVRAALHRHGSAARNRAVATPRPAMADPRHHLGDLGAVGLVGRAVEQQRHRPDRSSPSKAPSTIRSPRPAAPASPARTRPPPRRQRVHEADRAAARDRLDQHLAQRRTSAAKREGGDPDLRHGVSSGRERRHKHRARRFRWQRSLRRADRNPGSRRRQPAARRPRSITRPVSTQTVWRIWA